MPKQALNITDFSGGVNKVVNKRDIQDNQSPLINNLVAHHPGSIKMGGFFLSESNATSFGFNQVDDNKIATYLQPSAHFVKHYSIASLAISSGVGTITAGSAKELDLSVGTTFQFTNNTTSTFDVIIGRNYQITSNNGDGVHEFNYHIAGGTISGTETGSHIIVGGELVIEGHGNTYKAYSGTNQNRLILMSNGMGKFGYWDLATTAFIGSTHNHVTALGTNKWLFSTQYLWDFNQVNRFDTLDGFHTYSVSDNQLTINTIESFYVDGVVRVIEDMPKTWHYGFCRRPVGYYYIPQHVKFGTVDADNIVTSPGINYLSGWYPLRSHCLSPGEYRNAWDYNNSGFNQCAGTLYSGNRATLTLMSANELVKPDYSNQVNIFISGVSTIGTGEFQCAEDSEHSKMAIGISYIYDDIDQITIGNYSQESSITKLTTDGLAPDGTNELITIVSGVDNTALLIGARVNVDDIPDGDIHSTVGYTSRFNNSASSIHTVMGEQGSKDLNYGFNNMNIWNPRIVGANIWLMQTAFDVIEPSLLGTLNFYGNSSIHGISNSHDSFEASPWSTDGQAFKVVSPPIMDYYSHTGYTHTEQHQVWYKTSAIVNRKLYVGNIAYFSSIDPLKMNDTDTLESHPDKLLMSIDSNKFDIMPISNALEIAKFDGQDIVHLENFNNELLVFKTNDLFTIDCTGERELLKATHRGKGIQSRNHCVSNDQFMFFYNSTGLYAYDGENISDLVVDKIPSGIWSEKIYSLDTNISYDDQQDLLLICTRYNANGVYSEINDSNNLIVYNLINNSLIYKSDISNVAISALSKGINSNNKLYALSYQSTQEFNTSTVATSDALTTAFIGGSKPSMGFMFTFSANGVCLHDGSTAAEEGFMNNKCLYLKILQQHTGTDQWITLNVNPFSIPDFSEYPYQDHTLYGATGTLPSEYGKQRNLRVCKEAIKTNLENAIHSDYEFISCSLYPGGYIYLLLKGKKERVNEGLGAGVNCDTLGAPYNTFDAEDDEIQWGFSAIAPATPSAVLNDHLQGNSQAAADAVNTAQYSGFNLTNHNSQGVNPTNSVHTITIDANGNTPPGAGSQIRITYRTIANNGPVYFYGTYEVGLNYWADVNPSNYTYTSETEETVESDIQNKIAANITQAMIDSKLWSPSHSAIMTVTSSSNVITITSDFTNANIEGNQVQSITAESSVLNIEDISITRQQSYLLHWVNDITNYSVTSSGFIYETKDIDFGQPNVRKKISKAYITYTGGNGTIKCYYQADQAGTWIVATILDADGSAVTNSGHLNTSSGQTRAQLKFGTGGNNKYSFALKFEGGEGSTDFEINDISIIYRLKSAK